MGIMDQRMGSKESVFVTYVSGGLIVTLLMLATGKGRLSLGQGVPWYAFTAGIFGLIVVGTIGYTVPRMGMAKAFTLMVASQLIAAAVFDHFGLLGSTVREVGLQRLAGLLLIVAGVWLTLM